MATKSLDARIAAALSTNGKAADRAALAALNNEAADEIDKLEAVIKDGEASLLNIANETPDQD